MAVTGLPTGYGERDWTAASHEFRYTKIDGPVAATYARVTSGVTDDPKGNAPAIACFAFARTDNTWRPCTASTAAAGALR